MIAYRACDQYSSGKSAQTRRIASRISECSSVSAKFILLPPRSDITHPRRWLAIFRAQLKVARHHLTQHSDGRKVLRRARNWRCLHASAVANGHRNRQPAVHRADAESAAAAPRCRIRAYDAARSDPREQHLHAWADRRLVGRRHDAGHDARQSGFRQDDVSESGLHRRHDHGAHHGCRETRVGIEAGPRRRHVRASRHQPTRRSRLFVHPRRDDDEASAHD